MNSSLDIVSLISLFISLISVGVSIRLIYVSWKNSRKQKIYSEDILCSTVIVKSGYEYIEREGYMSRGNYGINRGDELLLKVYSINQGIVWNFKIIKLEVFNNNESFIAMESVVYDFENDEKDININNFQTKYHTLEFAIKKFSLELRISKTPLGRERPYL